MDVLSDVLRVFELSSTLYFRAELSAPFGLAVPPNPGAARFHVALRGECFLTVESAASPVHLRHGDLALVPHGAPHHLTDRPRRTSQDLERALAEAGFPGHGAFRYGGGEDPSTSLVCGHFAFAREVLHPLLSDLPAVLHFPASEDHGFAWVDDAMRFLSHEVRQDRPGSRVVLERLSEILFIHMLRAYAERAGDRARVLAAIADPQLGRALAAIHEDPARRWSLQELARRAGLSRTLFAERFHALVGQTPMQYLARWRMDVVKAELAASNRSLAEIGMDVGYRSEAALSRAFKRLVGVGPGAYRAARRAHEGAS
ncbi:MAG: AraC family transcriptional regulator [Sandaracinaceae bacterium]